MKIEKIFLEDVPPFDEKIIDFRAPWSGEISSRVLFSGPNGCGKTAVLYSIAYLWLALGEWLNGRRAIKDDIIKKKISPIDSGGGALLIDGIPDFNGNSSSKSRKVLIFISDRSFFNKYVKKYSGVDIIGEIVPTNKKGTSELFFSGIEKEPFFTNWAEEYKKLILSGGKSKTPNMVFLDAEERKWVKAGKNIGKPVQEDMIKRWLYRYQASNKWESQLEASLITLKTTSLHKFHEIIRLLNTLLVNKEISPDIHPGENRLRITIKNKRNTWHTFDELSTGEREMLVLVYSIGRWMETGGVVLVDEPDLFLHPGIIPDVFSTLEKLVEERDGQLIVTSHLPEMWDRYENRAMRIKLDAGAHHE